MTPSQQVLNMLETSRLTRKQRREMGLTFVNVTRKLKQLEAAGAITVNDTPQEVAVEVLDLLYADSPQAFADPQVNWDEIIAFLEKLIPLILSLISLF